MKKLVCIREFLVLGVVVAGLVFATGCHTAEGFGDDVEEAGDSIEESLD